MPWFVMNYDVFITQNWEGFSLTNMKFVFLRVIEKIYYQIHQMVSLIGCTFKSTNVSRNSVCLFIFVHSNVNQIPKLTDVMPKTLFWSFLSFKHFSNMAVLQQLSLILFLLWGKIHIGKEHLTNHGLKYLRKGRNCYKRHNWQLIGKTET